MSTVRRDLIGLALVAAVLFLPWIGARDLWNPNEPLYGRAVQEMSERGDWLLPSVNGAPFDEKPILYFWMALTAARVTGGVSETALRLPSAIAGIAMVLLLYLLVEPFAGRRRARLAGLVLVTTFIVFWSARQVQMDLLLAACVLASIHFAVGTLDGRIFPRAGWLLTGAAAGLGFLAKGPVGLLLPALVVLAFSATMPRAGRASLRSIPWAVPAFLLVAAPWYAALWMRGETGFLAELLYRQNFVRFVEPWDHQRPWWYYLEYFWIDMAPWSLFVPLAWGLEAADDRERALHRLAWIWIAVLVVFFSLAASKRSPYILPLAPAVAVLVAALAERHAAGCLAGLRGALTAALHAVLGLLFAAVGVWLIVAPPEPLVLAARPLGAVSLAGGIGAVGLLVLRRRRPAAATAVLFGAVAAIHLTASASVLPAANAFKSHRALSEQILQAVGPEQPLRGFHEWSWRASYSFYTRRAIPNLDSEPALREFWSRPEEVFVLVEQGRLETFQATVGPAEPRLARSVGSNRVYLFSNRKPQEE